MRKILRRAEINHLLTVTIMAVVLGCATGYLGAKNSLGAYAADPRYSLDAQHQERLRFVQTLHDRQEGVVIRCPFCVGFASYYTLTSEGRYFLIACDLCAGAGRIKTEGDFYNRALLLPAPRFPQSDPSLGELTGYRSLSLMAAPPRKAPRTLKRLPAPKMAELVALK